MDAGGIVTILKITTMTDYLSQYLKNTFAHALKNRLNFVSPLPMLFNYSALLVTLFNDPKYSHDVSTHILDLVLENSENPIFTLTTHPVIKHSSVLPSFNCRTDVTLTVNQYEIICQCEHFKLILTSTGTMDMLLADVLQTQWKKTLEDNPNLLTTGWLPVVLTSSPQINSLTAHCQQLQEHASRLYDRLRALPDLVKLDLDSLLACHVKKHDPQFYQARWLFYINDIIKEYEITSALPKKGESLCLILNNGDKLMAYELGLRLCVKHRQIDLPCASGIVGLWTLPQGLLIFFEDRNLKLYHFKTLSLMSERKIGFNQKIKPILNGEVVIYSEADETKLFSVWNPVSNKLKTNQCIEQFSLFHSWHDQSDFQDNTTGDMTTTIKPRLDAVFSSPVPVIHWLENQTEIAIPLTIGSRTLVLGQFNLDFINPLLQSNSNMEQNWEVFTEISTDIEQARRTTHQFWLRAYPKLLCDAVREGITEYLPYLEQNNIDKEEKFLAELNAACIWLGQHLGLTAPQFYLNEKSGNSLLTCYTKVANAQQAIALNQSQYEFLSRIKFSWLSRSSPSEMSPISLDPCFQHLNKELEIRLGIYLKHELPEQVQAIKDTRKDVGLYLKHEVLRLLSFASGELQVNVKLPNNIKAAEIQKHALEIAKKRILSVNAKGEPSFNIKQRKAPIYPYHEMGKALALAYLPELSQKLLLMFWQDDIPDTLVNFPAEVIHLVCANLCKNAWEALQVACADEIPKKGKLRKRIQQTIAQCNPFKQRQINAEPIVMFGLIQQSDQFSLYCFDNAPTLLGSLAIQQTIQVRDATYGCSVIENAIKNLEEFTAFFYKAHPLQTEEMKLLPKQITSWNLLKGESVKQTVSSFLSNGDWTCTRLTFSSK